MWVRLKYKICMTFMRTNIIILWYKYGNKNSRTVGVQMEYGFYVNHTLQLKWSTFVGTIFLEYKWGTYKVLNTCSVCGYKKIKCTPIVRHHVTVPRICHFLDYCRRLSQTAKRTTTGNPWAGFCGVVVLRPLVIS